MALERLLNLMAERKASDLFLAAGSPITIKINGMCVPINQEKMAPQAIVQLLTERLTDAQFRELEETRDEFPTRIDGRGGRPDPVPDDRPAASGEAATFVTPTVSAPSMLARRTAATVYGVVPDAAMPTIASSAVTSRFTASIAASSSSSAPSAASK